MWGNCQRLLPIGVVSSRHWSASGLPVHERGIVRLAGPVVGQTRGQDRQRFVKSRGSGFCRECLCRTLPTVLACDCLSSHFLQSCADCPRKPGHAESAMIKHPSTRTEGYPRSFLGTKWPRVSPVITTTRGEPGVGRSIDNSGGAISDDIAGEINRDQKGDNRDHEDFQRAG